MRVLFSVQRYGTEFAGGAEAACRGFAEGLARRGHRVEVLTSCARDYVTWRDHYPPGREWLNGVLVHRFRVRAERTLEQFDLVSRQVLGRHGALPVERDWLRAQGPDIPEIAEFLRDRAHEFDVAVFYTYLYPTSALALPVAASRTATVLHPAAHHEPMLALRVYDEVFDRADGIAVHTPEEAALVRRRFAPPGLVGVLGAGIDTDYPGGDGARFREQFGIGDGPLVLCVGRVDVNKGADELIRYFDRYRRFDPSVRLAVVGDRVHITDEVDGVIFTGFVSDETKHDAYGACHVFVMPSYLESFSIALCDAWVHERPALVQRHCDVLEGQVRRSRGGLSYGSYAEFALGLSRLLGDPALRTQLAAGGRRYVLDNYTWPVVLDRYECFLRDVIENRRSFAAGGVVASR